MNKKKWIVASLLVMVLLIMPLSSGCGSDPSQDLGQVKDAVKKLEETLGKPSGSVTLGDITVIQGPGQYAAGRFAGPVIWKAKPDRDEMVVGMAFDYIDIKSQFMHWLEEDGVWISVGTTSSPRGSKEFNSPPETPSTWLYFGGMDPLRGPGKYKLIVYGNAESYVVEEVQTVGGGCDPKRVSRDEFYEEIIFTVTGK